MKLGVICDGISRDLSHALPVSYTHLTLPTMELV